MNLQKKSIIQLPDIPVTKKTYIFSIENVCKLFPVLNRTYVPKLIRLDMHNLIPMINLFSFLIIVEDAI